MIYAEISKIMVENGIENEGLRCLIVTSIRDELALSAEKYGFDSRQVKTLEYCGVSKDVFERLCTLTRAVYSYTSDPQIEIVKIAWAIVKLYRKGKLDDYDMWKICDYISEKYMSDGEDEDQKEEVNKK